MLWISMEFSVWILLLLPPPSSCAFTRIPQRCSLPFPQLSLNKHGTCAVFHFYLLLNLLVTCQCWALAKHWQQIVSHRFCPLKCCHVINLINMKVMVPQGDPWHKEESCFFCCSLKMIKWARYEQIHLICTKYVKKQENKNILYNGSHGLSSK